MEICQGTKPHGQPPHVKPNPLTSGGERPTRQSSLNSQAAGPSPRRQTGRTGPGPAVQQLNAHPRHSTGVRLPPTSLPAPGLLPVAEPEKGPSMELEATPALHRPSPAVSEPASPPSAVAELEHLLPSSPCVPGAELQSAGPSAFPGIFTPALTIDIEPTVTPDGSCCVTPKNQLREENPDLDFPSRLVTEQLTYMDAELFKKLLPHQCLGSVWSKHNKPGSEHLAPTVWATVAQFNGVSECVITTCLGNPSMTARDRAMVVEHWIKVAKACQILQNYYSLNAIVSALQTVSIYHLKKTWEKVSRSNHLINLPPW
ncbi:ral guanine nucleotide dissociation stimulator-like isoform X1 [Ursus arctos]|uniref:ral guanine nucleotide dissociation stimulator-like n=1 Tax=Ursus arctos TaxID=9644 RepID=UPI002016C8A5|nr:ral guanine nucleotide dissociation stimulator-like [Ursus arctos]XP_048077210.1 ral guanine nucleotide dissociation stimulator-like isoform X1 [Ursus arctos]XP_057168946.1 ral guanine nucleotide dissociation stimulator-like [Ursus arctos]XP_057168947.1 ral guanine nucleotide dissociation stimulator-like [Ursus arctos]XP_057168948.1 ral guanine nucleotide dissociation stimulator-like [Ursus arctos]XP_057168949.1 ral guanine nucleotide dissociation stimulator-like [Ursus arctos]XP_057168950